MIKFGTGGYRGVIAEDFTNANVRIIGQGIAEVIKSDQIKTPVVVGFDHRFLSDCFARVIAEVLAANHINTLLFTEPMPSPAVMSAVKDEGVDIGVMFTASHNPYIYNGVKLFLKGGVDADVNFTDRLESIINIPGFTAKKYDKTNCSYIKDYTNIDKYLDNIKAFVDLKAYKDNNLNILYDNLFGVGAKCITRLFKDLKVKDLTVLHAVHDPLFGGMLPNPTEAMMLNLKPQLKSGGFNFAMATDSDADRLGILDENGNYISSNHIMAIIYYYLIKYRGYKGDIVKNCATSVLIDKLAAKLGFCCHEVDVGFKNISFGMKQFDALLGGESSGGLTVRGYISGKDSVFSSALFTEAVAAIDLPVSKIVQLVNDYADYHMTFIEDEIKISEGLDILSHLKNAGAVFGNSLKRINVFNRNCKLYFENDSWALLRLSGTEPVLRVFAEFETFENAKKHIDILRQYITSFI